MTVALLVVVVAELAVVIGLLVRKPVSPVRYSVPKVFDRKVEDVEPRGTVEERDKLPVPEGMNG